MVLLHLHSVEEQVAEEEPALRLRPTMVAVAELAVEFYCWLLRLFPWVLLVQLRPMAEMGAMDIPVLQLAPVVEEVAAVELFILSINRKRTAGQLRPTAVLAAPVVEQPVWVEALEVPEM
jgi:hypothetical protein